MTAIVWGTWTKLINLERGNIKSSSTIQRITWRLSYMSESFGSQTNKFYWRTTAAPLPLHLSTVQHRKLQFIIHEGYSPENVG